ncbi:MAG: NACHT domain-containing protein, partial [Caldilineaceae bacterium]|nr:NACHT domain-containing protein [Caldilineaceae bacterium]
MTMLDSGYSEAAASLFIWVADKTLGGVKKAFGWSWDQVAWAKAQDRYDAEIIRQHGTIRIFGQTTPKPLREIYTDVFVLDTPTAHRRFGPEQLAVHLWNEERGLPFRHAERKPGIGLLDSGTQFFLLGKPGAGKTTFLKYLAVREARRGAWGRSLGKLPIFVPLRQYADAGKSLFDFIVDQFDVCHFPGNAAPFVDALLASGKALVLFDGLDEVAKSDAEDRRGAVTAELMTFARTYSRCHILITCRIAAIDTTLDDGFTYLEMADFVPEQV